MIEANRNTVASFTKIFRNFAAWYAIIVPAVSLAGILLLVETKNSMIISPSKAALIFISSLVMGILSLFGRSVGVGTRALIFVGMLLSAVFGGFSIFACFLVGPGC